MFVPVKWHFFVTKVKHHIWFQSLQYAQAGKLYLLKFSHSHLHFPLIHHHLFTHRPVVHWDAFFKHVPSVLVYYTINSCHFACKTQKLVFYLESTSGLRCTLLNNNCEQKMFKLLFNVMHFG